MDTQDKVFDRGNLDLATAQALAVHNANTLGGCWMVWSHPHTGQYHVTCPELVAGDIAACTHIQRGVAALIHSQGVAK